MTAYTDLPSLSSKYAVLTTQEMKKAEEFAMTRGVSAARLMQRAGQAVADRIQVSYQKAPTLVISGPGNNGGDGFVVAAQLKAAGWPVSLIFLGEAESLSAEAKEHFNKWKKNGDLIPFSSKALMDNDICVDAIFGTGLKRPPEGLYAEVIKSLNAANKTIIAVDMPSGLSSDSGAPLNDVCVTADQTVTFFRKKIGHVLYPGKSHCGEISVADIGIPGTSLDSIQPKTFENSPQIWHSHFPWKTMASHKHDYGRLAILGSEDMSGATRLAAGAALRLGVGLLHILAPKAARQVYQLESPSFIVHELTSYDAVPAMLEDMRATAFLLGPGAGVGKELGYLSVQKTPASRPYVLDADAITSLAKYGNEVLSSFQSDKNAGSSADSLWGTNKIITPHAGEFARLFPNITGTKPEKARAAAYNCGAIVLYKGSDTVIADPGGLCVINTNAPPYLAIGGTGDVLAGMIASLAAQHMPLLWSAAAAAWLHGDCAHDIGIGLIAEDIPKNLPATLKKLEGSPPI